MLIILFLGPPGVGKGSLSHRLVEKYGFFHFSTGKIFRSKKDKNIASGSLVTDDYVNSLVLEELGKISKSGSFEKIILDGYPRTINQAEFIKNHFPIDKVFFLTNVSREFIIKRLDNRLLCEKEDHSFNLLFHPPKVPGICDHDGSPLYKRSDDTIEIIQKRLDVFESSTKPLIDYYKSYGNLIELDASKNIEEILEEMSKYISFMVS